MIKTHILNDDTSAPISGAAVVMTDVSGKELSSVFTTNEDGSVSIPDEYFENSASKRLRITAQGFETKIQDADRLGFGSIFLIPLAGSSTAGLGEKLADTDTEKDKKPNHALPIILGILSLGCLVVSIVVKE